ERNFWVWGDELREIGEIADATAQKQRLNEFVADRLQKNMDGKDAELGDTLRRYTLGSMQQYRTRYLLAKLAQHVEMAFKGMSAPGSLGEFIALEIEHILPNNPETDLRQSFATANPGKGYDDYKVRLRQLTLLQRPNKLIAEH